MSDDTENKPKPRRTSHRISDAEYEAQMEISRALKEGKGRVAYNLDQSARRAQQGKVLVSDSGSDDLPGKRAADPNDPSVAIFQSVTIQDLSKRDARGEHAMLTVRDDGSIQTQDGQWIDPELAATVKKAVGAAMHDGKVTPEEAQELSALAVSAREPTDGVVRTTKYGAERHARLGDTVVQDNLNAPDRADSEPVERSVSLRATGPDGVVRDLHISADGAISNTLEGCVMDKDFAKKAVEAVARILRDGKIDASEAKEIGDIVSNAPKLDGPGKECGIER